MNDHTIFDKKVKNPITRMDYPDADVIRVEDTYYMVSTTMHFMPGCEILRSYDLVNWEHASYVYDKLDSTPGQMLSGGENCYGKGMWAATLRFHKGHFYVCFVANDTGKTYLYIADKIEGPWEKHNMEGFYHDCSLLFDDDNKVYLAYGNKNVYIVELKEDLSGPMPGCLPYLAVSDSENKRLGYEGAHFYKINGLYYLFLIHSLKEEWKRVQACFVSDSPLGKYRGGDILNDDMGYCNQGIAQGGVVDTPNGKWYSILFQDRGAVGRIPVLIPMTWEERYPVLGKDGRVPDKFGVRSTRPEHQYEPLMQSDDFAVITGLCKEAMQRKYGCFGFKSAWQFNHEPDVRLIRREAEGGYFVKTDKLCAHVTEAKNTLTQRMQYPGCIGEVTVITDKMKEGDYAGICALQEEYGLVGVTKREGRYYIVMKSKTEKEEREWEICEVAEEEVVLKVEAEFTGMKDEAKFYFLQNGTWKQIGVTHKMHFSLAHFTGYRFGLFVYATKQTGGEAGFANFVYRTK